MNRIFVAFSFITLSFNLFGAQLNYLELYLLRSEHEEFTSQSGASEILINSSDRFNSLYQNLQSDDLEKINNEVEQAYSAPYMTRISLKQFVKFSDFIFRLSMHESISLRINNPVFPELDLFNVRTDSLSIQRKFNINQYISSKFVLSFINRWYINQSYSLEELVTDDLELDLKQNETISTFYLDFFFESRVESFNHSLEMIGLDLLNRDLYDYQQSKYKLLIETSLIEYGFSMTPLYSGSYKLKDTLSLELQKRFLWPIDLTLSLSDLYKKLDLKFSLDHVALRLAYEQIKEFDVSTSEVKNYSFNLILKY